MRTSFLLIGTCAMLSSCGDRPPRDCAVATAPQTAMKCLERNASKGEREQLLACFPFAPPERMRGIWAIGMERSSFYENAERYSAARDVDDDHDVWLYVDDSLEKAAQSMTAPPNQWLSVEFVGSRSLCDGLWGHMGMSKKAVIVDKMLSAKR